MSIMEYLKECLPGKKKDMDHTFPGAYITFSEMDSHLKDYIDDLISKYQIEDMDISEIDDFFYGAMPGFEKVSSSFEKMAKDMEFLYESIIYDAKNSRTLTKEYYRQSISKIHEDIQEYNESVQDCLAYLYSVGMFPDLSRDTFRKDIISSRPSPSHLLSISLNKGFNDLDSLIERMDQDCSDDCNDLIYLAWSLEQQTKVLSIHHKDMLEPYLSFDD